MALYWGSKRCGQVMTSDTITLIPTDDATATEPDVLAGKTYYAQDGLHTGTGTYCTLYIGTTDAAPDASVGQDGDLYLALEEA